MIYTLGYTVDKQVGLHRTFAFDDIKLDTHGRQRGKDVTEHDHTIWLESSPGLEREL